MPISSHMKTANAVESIPVEILAQIQKQLGISFKINNGVVTGFTFCTPKGRKIKISIEGGKTDGKAKKRKGSRTKGLDGG